MNRIKSERQRDRQEMVIARKIASPRSPISALVKDIVSERTFTNWMQYPDFKERYLAAGEAQVPEDRRLGDPSAKLDFVAFRRIVLGRHTFPHQQEWINWFNTDANDHILILCPPESSKTSVVLDYILYLIYLDPNIKVGYASKALPHSIKQVSKVKNIIEQNAALRNLCGEMVPQSGDPHPWRDTYFTVRLRSWTAGQDEADYTLAAFGAGSQITGSRFDLLVFDDPDDVNIGPADREKIWNVILQAGETRLGTSGRMIVIGNRQDDEDVYRRILEQWQEEPSLWAVYTQKAILREPGAGWPQDAHSEPPIVFWPEKFGLDRKDRASQKNVRPDGLWTLERAFEFFDRKRRRLGHRFHLVYQNDPQGDREKDFTREMVDRALDSGEIVGKVPAGSLVVCALDPAPSGGAAVLVYAVCPPDKDGRIRRKVVDFEYGSNWRHTGHVERIKRFGEQYHPRWWVIERSATSKLFLQDKHILDMIAGQGAWLYDLTTTANKESGDFAVSSLRELFLGDPTPVILPGATALDKDRTKALRDQLVDYYPGTTAPHDGPMALWFAERCVRDKGLANQIRRRNVGQKMAGFKSSYGGEWKGGAWSMAKPGSNPIIPGNMVESSSGEPIKITPR
jgi:hypothetical protein